VLIWLISQTLCALQQLMLALNLTHGIRSTS